MFNFLLFIYYDDIDQKSHFFSLNTLRSLYGNTGHPEVVQFSLEFSGDL